ncbi:hypothetical protein IFM89_012426 [Coptis chinensis]|uniref:Hexosyltransferase n=1 Tax=Coptis chinensis TaxID=261450 RepID=A0A835IC85_9MAGN|nr:hypothetical protein IFM89_012426 [Coptis chinensis]
MGTGVIGMFFPLRLVIALALALTHIVCPGDCINIARYCTSKHCERSPPNQKYQISESCPLMVLQFHDQNQTKILPAKYIMKTDDDAFVRIEEILSRLGKKTSNSLLYGLIYFVSSSQDRDRDKEMVYHQSEEGPHASFPPWAHGPGYILSRDIAKSAVRRGLMHHFHHGLMVLVNTPQGILEISSGLLGRHNIYNIVVAVAVGIVVGAPLEGIVRGIEEVDSVPGREKEAHLKWEQKLEATIKAKADREAKEAKLRAVKHKKRRSMSDSDDDRSDSSGRERRLKKRAHKKYRKHSHSDSSSHCEKGKDKKSRRKLKKCSSSSGNDNSNDGYESDSQEGMTKYGCTRRGSTDIRSQDLILAFHIIPVITTAGDGKRKRHGSRDQDSTKEDSLLIQTHQVMMVRMCQGILIKEGITIGGRSTSFLFFSRLTAVDGRWKSSLSLELLVKQSVCLYDVKQRSIHVNTAALRPYSQLIAMVQFYKELMSQLLRLPNILGTRYILAHELTTSGATRVFNIDDKENDRVADTTLDLICHILHEPGVTKKLEGNPKGVTDMLGFV